MRELKGDVSFFSLAKYGARSLAESKGSDYRNRWWNLGRTRRMNSRIFRWRVRKWWESMDWKSVQSMNCSNRGTQVNKLERYNVMAEESNAWNQYFSTDATVCDDKSSWHHGSTWLIQSWIKGHLRYRGQETEGLECWTVYPCGYWNHRVVKWSRLWQEKKIQINIHICRARVRVWMTRGFLKTLSHYCTWISKKGMHYTTFPTSENIYIQNILL